MGGGTGASAGSGRQPRETAADSSAALVRSHRCIALIDLDCFYAQCETRRDPSLAGKPVGVRQKHLVITSNYAARAYGIKKGDSLAEVRRKCPDIVIKDGEDISHYTEVSNAWRAFVANFVGSRCPVEKSGLDELFVDVSAAVDAHGAGGAGEIGHVHGDDVLGDGLVLDGVGPGGLLGLQPRAWPNPRESEALGRGGQREGPQDHGLCCCLAGSALTDASVIVQLFARSIPIAVEAYEAAQKAKQEKLEAAEPAVSETVLEADLSLLTP